MQEAQAEVRRAERLAALGQLTAGLAHELRNPLGTMKTSAQLLSRQVAKENAVAQEMAGFITSEVDRTNSLITRFLDFARPQHLKLETADITSMLDGAIGRFEREQKNMGTSVTVFKNYSPDVPPVRFDAELMERVIANLLVNAAQASPPGGVVTVKTMSDDAEVEVAVIDRGSGIEPKNIENIFNPFFTTKSDGIGFGLAIISKILDEHGGRITVESTPGEGSVFRVFLPAQATITHQKRPMGKATILVIEDEEKQRRVVGLHLASADYDVKGAGTAEEGWKLAGEVDLILTDLKLPGMDGLQLLEMLKAQNSHTPVIVMSAFSTVENAVEAMKRGAVDFLPKPFSLDHLSVVVEKALELRKLRDENRDLREALGQRYQFENIIGKSQAMQEIFATITRVAGTRATVLLAGESGVGKDMIARAIHQHSPRRDRPFVKINCTAIPENLMESELFGYEKGAFTGANISKPGKFEQANTGTVMLDEIGDVPASVQVKLLRILQEREFERLGSNKTQHTDVRVIAATNVDLRAALEQGTFREDLYYRLNVVPMNIPPLRERKEDIPYLGGPLRQKIQRRPRSARARSSV